MTHDVLELPGLDDLHASSDLSSLGSLQLGVPTSDINGDGVLDTVVENHPGSQYVLTDVNRDGVVDHFTIIDTDGQFSAWHYQPGNGAHWTQVDHGRIGK